MGKNVIVIEIQGGVVEKIISTTSPTVVIVDHDQADRGEQMCYLLEPHAIVSDVKGMYTNQTDQRECEIFDFLRGNKL